jgi:CMP-N-acetylneuraminic acid synthetase
MKFVAVIPARKGSKGLVGKNTRLFAGKPLIEYSIVESVGCSMIDETIVSSDDELALALATNYLCTIHKRPSNLAGDDVDMLAVLKDVITSFSLNLKYDALVLMQPTSPLRFGNILNKCLMKFKSDNPASLMTIVSTWHRVFANSR